MAVPLRSDSDSGTATPDAQKVSARSTPVRPDGYNYNLPFATQGAWRIPTETVCSFQAATLPTLSAILSGDGFDEETKRVAVSSSGSLTLWFAANEQIASAKFLSFTFFSILLRSLNHSNDALP
jgi:hypothetical protein